MEQVGFSYEDGGAFIHPQHIVKHEDVAECPLGPAISDKATLMALTMVGTYLYLQTLQNTRV